MPPDPSEVEARALGVLQTVRLARRLAQGGGMVGLAPEGRDVPEGLGQPPEGAGQFIALLVRAGLPVLPRSTHLLNVFYDGEGEVTLNFSEHLRVDHPGGSAAEFATLHCLVATIGQNFPEVARVRLLIGGESVSTLAGHADISSPLHVSDYR